MRASLAGLLAACALIGIPRLVSELREYRKESRQPAPIAISAPPETRPAIVAAPIPKVLDTKALSKPAPVLKVPDAAVFPKLMPVRRVSMQPETSPFAGAGAKSAGPADGAELVPAIQKELTRLGHYEGPITDKWNRPVRSAAREFLRKTGTRARHPQPTPELLAALKAAEPVKVPAAPPPAAAHPAENPIRPSAPSAKETLPVKEAPPKQSAAAPVPAAQDEDYLPPWMTAKTDQARLAAKEEAARSDAPVDASSGVDETPKRTFHRRHHAERYGKGRRHYVSRGGYYSRRRAYLFPF